LCQTFFSAAVVGILARPVATPCAEGGETGLLATAVKGSEKKPGRETGLLGESAVLESF